MEPYHRSPLTPTRGRWFGRKRPSPERRIEPHVDRRIARQRGVRNHADLHGARGRPLASSMES